MQLGGPVQIGWVVNDLHFAMRDIGQALGIIEWTLSEWPNPRYYDVCCYHRGQRGDGWKAKMAIGKLETFDVELVQPVEGESCYSEWIAKHGQSLHHMMYRVGDVSVVLAELACWVSIQLQSRVRSIRGLRTALGST